MKTIVSIMFVLIFVLAFARIIYNFKKALTIFTSPMKPPSQNRDPVEYYFRNPEYQLSSFRPRQ